MFLIMVCIFSMLVLSGNPYTCISFEAVEGPNSGAYIDRVVYQYVYDSVLALQSDTIDAIYEPFDPVYLDTLNLDPDIGVYAFTQNAYAQILINCRDYPLNISGLRRAFAFAFNKTRVISEVLNGQGLVHDSVIPDPSSFCIENELPWHYYTDQSDLGNYILDALNFTIDGGTGYRLAPDGTSFSIELESWYADGMEIAQIGADALESLHIDARTRMTSTADLLEKVITHGFYDMVILYGRNFYANYVDWMADEFWSEKANEEGYNPTNFANATFDMWRDQLINGSSYEDVYEASSAMQSILHENVPVLVLFERIEYQAYRTDEFIGYVEDPLWGIAGPWTNLKVHEKVGYPFGGTFTVALKTHPSTFNFFLTSGGIEDLFKSNLYSGMCKVGPDLQIYPDLAKDILIETHASNPSVPQGQTWLTADIRTGAKWSDGISLTALDVASTFTYLQESYKYGNPNSLLTMYYNSSKLLSSYTVRLVFDSMTYREMQDILLTPIIPQHVFNNDTGIGYDEWYTWNPVFGEDPYVTCGPFYLSDYNSSILELRRNLDYHWLSGAAPKVLFAEDVSYAFGTTGNYITWEVEDEDPFEYTIFGNGSLEVTSDWNGSDIIYNIDGLSVGRYNYTLILYDKSRHVVANTIWVTVTQDSFIMGLEIVVASVIIISAVGAVVYWKHHSSWNFEWIKRRRVT